MKLCFAFKNSIFSSLFETEFFFESFIIFNSKSSDKKWFFSSNFHFFENQPNDTSALSKMLFTLTVYKQLVFYSKFSDKASEKRTNWVKSWKIDNTQTCQYLYQIKNSSHHAVSQSNIFPMQIVNQLFFLFCLNLLSLVISNNIEHIFFYIQISTLCAIVFIASPGIQEYCHAGYSPSNCFFFFSFINSTIHRHT